MADSPSGSSGSGSGGGGYDFSSHTAQTGGNDTSTIGNVGYASVNFGNSDFFAQASGQAAISPVIYVAGGIAALFILYLIVRH